MIGALVLLKLYLHFSIGYTDENVDMKGKVCIVTGANTGLGQYTAQVLAKNGAHVILAVRSLERGEKAAKCIRSLYPNSLLTVMKLDLGDLNSVNEFVKSFEAKNLQLNVLVNNAGLGTVPSGMPENEQGYETMFMVNHVGPYLLTKKLLPKMLGSASNTESDPGRIVFLSSMVHTFVTAVNVDNMERFTKNPIMKTSFAGMMDSLNQYGFTKLANLYNMFHLIDTLKQSGAKNVTVNAVHPGAVSTDINREVHNLPLYKKVYVIPLSAASEKLFFRTVSQGAQSSIHAACSPSLRGISGQYIIDCKDTETSKLAKDEAMKNKLVEITEKIIKPY
jgi:NAD(P)-dependent dehydrogenase (short-subunit alcohol dehydrogenase family)